MTDTHTAKIVLGSTPRATKIEIDGREQTMIERFTLSASAVDDGPARLDLVRVLTRQQANARGLDGDAIVDGGVFPREDVRVYLARIEIEGAVELVDDAMRAAATAALNEARAMALTSFMIQGDETAPYSLGEILQDAARYRAIRRFVDAINGGTVIFDSAGIPVALDDDANPPNVESCQHGEELDKVADNLRAHVRADDGHEPLDVLPPITPPEIVS